VYVAQKAEAVAALLVKALKQLSALQFDAVAVGAVEVVVDVPVGTPFGPAVICTMFVVVALNTVFASKTRLLSISYTTYMLVRAGSPKNEKPPPLEVMRNWQKVFPPLAPNMNWLIGALIVTPWKIKLTVVGPNANAHAIIGNP